MRWVETRMADFGQTPPMRSNGITYDAGFINDGVSTHEPFDPEVRSTILGTSFCRRDGWESE